MILINADNGAQQLDTTVALGNGTWNCADYWSVAHSAGPGKDLPPPGCTATATQPIQRLPVRDEPHHRSLAGRRDWRP
jgi:hypothetical protein